VRLVEVALEYGAKAAYRVDYAHEIQQEWLDGVETVGVTSGASVPEVLVQEVLADLAGAGYADVEQVRTAEEDLMFSLPKELRQDARDAGTTVHWAGGRADERPDRIVDARADAAPASAVRRVCEPGGAAGAHPAARRRLPSPRIRRCRTRRRAASTRPPRRPRRPPRARRAPRTASSRSPCSCTVW
jgi:hypothetical protein